jgi:hypothetical protein
MNAGLSGSDAYLEEWRRTSRPCGEDLDAEASTEADRLVATHPPDTINRLVANDGRADSQYGEAR